MVLMIPTPTVNCCFILLTSNFSLYDVENSTADLFPYIIHTKLTGVLFWGKTSKRMVRLPTLSLCNGKINKGVFKKYWHSAVIMMSIMLLPFGTFPPWSACHHYLRSSTFENLREQIGVVFVVERRVATEQDVRYHAYLIK